MRYLSRYITEAESSDSAVVLEQFVVIHTADVCNAQTSDNSETNAALIRISLCTDFLMRKKLRVYPKFRFNPLPTRFYLTEFLPPSGVCSTSGKKRTSKHGISMVLKLVSIEYQKMGAFQAAL